jgi:outer membrane protein TolC
MIRPVLAIASALLLPAAVLAQGAPAYRLTLGDAARLASERSTPVLQAHARAEGAEARVRGTMSDLLPSLDADLMQSARTFNTASFGLDFPTIPGQQPFFDPAGEVVGPVKGTDVRARVSVPLLDFEALGRRRNARANADAAHEEESAVADAAAASAAWAYLATLRARAEVVAREEDLALAQDLLDVAEGLLEAGVGVAIDVTRAQSQVATIRAQLLGSQHRAEITDLTLRRSLRLPEGAELELVDDLESLEVESLPGEREAIARALDQRSDLSAAEAYEAAARQTVSTTRAGRLPTLSASVDEGYYGRRYDHLLNTYSWSIRLSVPLFDGFDRSSRLQEGEARVREIGYRIDDLEEEVSFQIRQSILDLGASQEQAEASAERLRLAELEVSQEEERLRAGVAGTADVVRAAMRLNEARTARLNALAAVQTSRVGLASAMGTVALLP